MRKNLALIATLTLLGFAAPCETVHALVAFPTWNGSVNGNWTTAANWTNATPTQFGNSSIVFANPGAGSLSTDVATGGQYFINNLSTNANATSFSINNTAGGSNELAIGGDVAIDQGASNLAAAINYPVFFNKTANTTLTFNVDGAGRSLAVKEIHRHSSNSLSVGQTVIKSGTGLMTLSAGGTSTYRGGTTINGGTLAINGTDSNGTGVAVNNTGTLAGTGSVIQPITVAAGGTIAPGNSIGTLNTGAVTLSAGTAALGMEIDLSGTPNADLLNVTGGVLLGGGTLNLSFLNGPPTLGSPLTFIIVANDDVDAINGTFGTITAAGYSVALNYAFVGTDALGRIGSGNDLALTVLASVPEAGSWAFGGLASITMAAVVGLRRRRQAV